MKIGFIGLGNMGSGMATNLMAAGYRLTINDLRPESAEALLKEGAAWADTPIEMAEKNEVIFTSLPGPQEVEAVVTGRDGILEGIRAGSILIDLSTNSPSLIRHIYSLFVKKDAHVLDAPVSGGVKGAKTALAGLWQTLFVITALYWPIRFYSAGKVVSNGGENKRITTDQ